MRSFFLLRKHFQVYCGVCEIILWGEKGGNVLKEIPEGFCGVGGVVN